MSPPSCSLPLNCIYQTKQMNPSVIIIQTGPQGTKIQMNSPGNITIQTSPNRTTIQYSDPQQYSPPPVAQFYPYPQQPQQQQLQQQQQPLAIQYPQYQVAQPLPPVVHAMANNQLFNVRDHTSSQLTEAEMAGIVGVMALRGGNQY